MSINVKYFRSTAPFITYNGSDALIQSETERKVSLCLLVSSWEESLCYRVLTADTISSIIKMN